MARMIAEVYDALRSPDEAKARAAAIAIADQSSIQSSEQRLIQEIALVRERLDARIDSLEQRLDGPIHRPEQRLDIHLMLPRRRWRSGSMGSLSGSGWSSCWRSSETRVARFERDAFHIKWMLGSSGRELLPAVAGDASPPA